MSTLNPPRYVNHYSVSFLADKSRAEPTTKTEVSLHVEEETYDCVLSAPYGTGRQHCFYGASVEQRAAAPVYTWRDEDADGKFSNADTFFIDSQEISKEERPYFQMAFQESFELILQAEIDAQAD